MFPYPWPPNKYSLHRLIGDESSAKRMSGEGGKKRRMTFWVTDIGWRVAFYCEPLTEKEEKERTSQFNARTKRARGLLRDGRCCTTSIGRQALTLCKCAPQIFCGKGSKFPLPCHQYLASSLPFQAILSPEKRDRHSWKRRWWASLTDSKKTCFCDIPLLVLMWE